MSNQKRPYRMTRRAHEEVGPAQTSISAIADRAGVRRSTVYRHFPDEASLFAACSAHWRAGNPAPDPTGWPALSDPAERTETALRELYAFYGRTSAMYASLMRDEPLLPIVQRLLGDFYGYLDAVQGILLAGRGLRGRRARAAAAAIGHALAFPTWQSLTQEQGLTNDEAAELMCALVDTAAVR